MHRPKKMPLGLKQYLYPQGCLTPNEISRKLGVTVQCVTVWIRKGRLKAAQSWNHYWWIKESDLKAFLKTRSRHKQGKQTAKGRKSRAT